MTGRDFFSFAGHIIYSRVVLDAWWAKGCKVERWGYLDFEQRWLSAYWPTATNNCIAVTYDTPYANLHCHNLFVFPPSFTPNTTVVCVCVFVYPRKRCKYTHHACLFEFSVFVLKWESPPSLSLITPHILWNWFASLDVKHF